MFPSSAAVIGAAGSQRSGEQWLWVAAAELPCSGGRGAHPPAPAGTDARDRLLPETHPAGGLGGRCFGPRW